MQAAIQLTSKVRAGGTITVSSNEFVEGQDVQLIVLFPATNEEKRHSIEEVLASAPGKLGFQTAEEVDAYIRDERAAWER